MPVLEYPYNSLEDLEKLTEEIEVELYPKGLKSRVWDCFTEIGEQIGLPVPHSEHDHLRHLAGGSREKLEAIYTEIKQVRRLHGVLTAVLEHHEVVYLTAAFFAGDLRTLSEEQTKVVREWYKNFLNNQVRFASWEAGNYLKDERDLSALWALRHDKEKLLAKLFELIREKDPSVLIKALALFPPEQIGQLVQWSTQAENNKLILLSIYQEQVTKKKQQERKNLLVAQNANLTAQRDKLQQAINEAKAAISTLTKKEKKEIKRERVSLREQEREYLEKKRSENLEYQGLDNATLRDKLLQQDDAEYKKIVEKIMANAKKLPSKKIVKALALQNRKHQEAIAQVEQDIATGDQDVAQHFSNLFTLIHEMLTEAPKELAESLWHILMSPQSRQLLSAITSALSKADEGKDITMKLTEVLSDAENRKSLKWIFAQLIQNNGVEYFVELLQKYLVPAIPVELFIQSVWGSDLYVPPKSSLSKGRSRDEIKEQVQQQLTHFLNNILSAVAKLSTGAKQSGKVDDLASFLADALCASIKGEPINANPAVLTLLSDQKLLKVLVEAFDEKGLVGLFSNLLVPDAKSSDLGEVLVRVESFAPLILQIAQAEDDKTWNAAKEIIANIVCNPQNHVLKEYFNRSHHVKEFIENSQMSYSLRLTKRRLGKILDLARKKMKAAEQSDNPGKNPLQLTLTEFIGQLRAQVQKQETNKQKATARGKDYIYPQQIDGMKWFEIAKPLGLTKGEWLNLVWGNLRIIGSALYGLISTKLGNFFARFMKGDVVKSSNVQRHGLDQTKELAKSEDADFAVNAVFHNAYKYSRLPKKASKTQSELSVNIWPSKLGKRSERSADSNDAGPPPKRPKI